MEKTSRHLRVRDDGHQRVTTLELFFDLVFVFAITQIAHYLLEHLTAGGVARATLLLLVVWWAWIYTTWMTNWFDPDRSRHVRLVILTVVGLALLMAVAIPYAFSSLSLLFAGSYVGLQLVRNSFNVWGIESGTVAHASFLRILWWSVAAGVLWISGAVIGGEWLVPIWCIALAVDYAGPLVRYWTPVLGSSKMTDWSIDAGHFAERFQLLIIIALGESIVVMGSTASKSDLSVTDIVAVVTAFATTVTMWWLYFNFVAERALERMRTSDAPERLARDAFTYLHIPIVAGIILAAVADEILIAHPNDPFAYPILAVAGPLVYLLGHNLFRLSMARSISMNRLIAMFALLAVIPLGDVLSALELSIVVLGILVALIVREELITVTPLAPG